MSFTGKNSIEQWGMSCLVFSKHFLKYLTCIRFEKYQIDLCCDHHESAGLFHQSHKISRDAPIPEQ